MSYLFYQQMLYLKSDSKKFSSNCSTPCPQSVSSDLKNGGCNHENLTLLWLETTMWLKTTYIFLTYQSNQNTRHIIGPMWTFDKDKHLYKIYKNLCSSLFLTKYCTHLNFAMLSMRTILYMQIFDVKLSKCTLNIKHLTVGLDTLLLIRPYLISLMCSSNNSGLINDFYSISQQICPWEKITFLINFQCFLSGSHIQHDIDQFLTKRNQHQYHSWY